jgi:hypothetical protein
MERGKRKCSRLDHIPSSRPLVLSTTAISSTTVHSLALYRSLQILDRIHGMENQHRQL